MVVRIVIANIVNLVAGICSILSVQGQGKQQIVFIEFIGTNLRIVSNLLVNGWTDALAKIIKWFTQVVSLKNKLNIKIFYLVATLYIMLCLTITYLSKDLRCLIAIVPSVIELYSLLVSSIKKYRWYIVLTKFFWILNNIVFKLYVGIVFDIIVVVGHILKIRKENLKYYFNSI